METVCRVCLADDRSTYRVANTALEQTYDVITGVELQRAGLPTALCCVCVSQLRRCRTFIETARESTAALDSWYRNHSHTDSKLTARPLINFTTTTEFVVDSEFWPQVKQEPLDTGNVGPIIIEEIKCEVIRDVSQSHPMHVSPEDSDHTQILNDEIDNTQLSSFNGDDITYRKEGRDVGGNNLHVEWNNVQDFNDVEEDKTQLSLNNKHEFQLLDIPGSEAAGTSNGEAECSVSSDQDIASRSPRSGKRINLNQDVTHYPMNINTTSTHRLQCCPYACDKCNYRCKQKTNLKKHLLIHTGQKPFTCDKCDFRCSQKGYLKKHLVIHTGEKPFACDKCDYRGSLKDKLKRHLMTHTGDKPFVCDKCEYRCSQKHKLKIHLMTHTGEKPFACDKCEYRSTHKFSLRKHLLKHCS